MTFNEEIDNSVLNDKIDHFKKVDSLLRQTAVKRLNNLTPSIIDMRENNVTCGLSYTCESHCFDSLMKTKLDADPRDALHVPNEHEDKMTCILSVSREDAFEILRNNFKNGFDLWPLRADAELDQILNIYTFKSKSSVIYIPSFLSVTDQLILGGEALWHYCQPPNNTNVNKHVNRDVDNDRDVSDDRDIHRSVSFWPHNKSLSWLRWVTIGHQYDWTLRKYIDSEDENSFVGFPKNLQSFAASLMLMLKILLTKLAPNNFDEEMEIYFSNYHPDCGIINMYRNADRLRGHRDDAETDPRAPIISISIGLSGIFLLGGRDRSVEPLPIVLRSGDILIMYGDERLSFHGFSRLLYMDSIGVDLSTRKCTTKRDKSDKKKLHKSCRCEKVDRHFEHVFGMAERIIEKICSESDMTHWWFHFDFFNAVRKENMVKSEIRHDNELSRLRNDFRCRFHEQENQRFDSMGSKLDLVHVLHFMMSNRINFSLRKR